MSIDRSELLDVLDALPFERGTWVVAGSAPLLMAGLVDAIADIDIVVDQTAWRQAVSIAVERPRAGLLGDHIVELEMSGSRVEVFDGWLGATAADMIAEAVEVEGVPCSPLERVLDSKRRLGRRRDLDHIRIIEAHIGGANSQQPRAKSQRPPSD